MTSHKDIKTAEQRMEGGSYLGTGVFVSGSDTVKTGYTGSAAQIAARNAEIADLRAYAEQVERERDALREQAKENAKAAAMTNLTLAGQMNDLSALVRRFIHASKSGMPITFADKAIEYLKRNNLQGSPLRMEDVLRESPQPVGAVVADDALRTEFLKQWYGQPDFDGPWPQHFMHAFSGWMAARRAALAAQTAAPQNKTIGKEYGQELRTGAAHQGNAQDGETNTGAASGSIGIGAHQHNQHRAWQPATDQQNSDGYSRSTGLSGSSQICSEVTAVPQTVGGVDASEIDFLEEWLTLASTPVGLECCGQSSGECCGNGVAVERSAEEVISAMAERHRELSAALAKQGEANG